jgi:hypothetical protein
MFFINKYLQNQNLLFPKEFLFFFFRFRVLSVEDSDIAYKADNLAFCRLCDLGGDFFFGFLEFAEFYFD